MAAVAGAEGQPRRAAQLFGAADVQWRVSGGVRYTPDQPTYERDIAEVRAQLDESAFAVAWAEGLAMNTEQAIAYALAVESPQQDADRRPDRRRAMAGGPRAGRRRYPGACPWVDCAL
jgi:hypothetical protein